MSRDSVIERRVMSDGVNRTLYLKTDERLRVIYKKQGQRGVLVKY